VEAYRISDEFERDPSNVHYSNGLSEIYDENGSTRPYIRKKFSPILKEILDELGKDPCDVDILDVGVGYGGFLRLCEEEGLSKLSGMDPHSFSLELASRFTKAELHQGDLRQDYWPFERESKDVITCFDVIEHLEQPEVLFQRAMDYVKPGGLLAIRTPNGGFSYNLRRIPVIGIKDTNTTHINVRPPSFWFDILSEYGWTIINHWKGEHLTHLRSLQTLGEIMDKMRISHKNIPILNDFEQSFIMILRKE
jgi:2-polyprenyl-3-methyl-5-hydroxy-6-metoxy-1,4-benzoquinol methylase